MPPSSAATPLPNPIVVDCDPGIDDAVALLLAAASPDLATLSAITAVHGNVPLAATARNAQRIRALAGCYDVPVHAGCPRPMTAASLNAAHVHSDDGLGGVTLDDGPGGLAGEHGVDTLIRLGMAGHTVVAVGPLTNVAVALIKRPDLADVLPRLVVMGGGLDRGNVTPLAEFNIFADPEAARAVLTATDWPSASRPVVFPLDATRQAVVTTEWIDDLAASGGPICRAAAAMLSFYDRAVGARHGGVHVHDAMALAWTLRPDLFDVRPARLEVMTDSGAARGRTVADFASTAPGADIVVEVNAPAFLDWLRDRLMGLDAR